MSAVLDEISDYGLSMPWMAAVRLDGVTITYGELAGDLDVLMSESAAYASAPTTLLFAALMRRLPRANSGSPVEGIRRVGEAVRWISRRHEPALATVTELEVG